MMVMSIQETNIHLFTELAGRALTYYKLGNVSLDYINHSENVTFMVSADSGETYLLRLHTPKNPAMGNHGANISAVRSELQWLEALHQNALPVQRPQRNTRGQWVTQLALDDGSIINCSLLEWLPGVIYEREMETEDTVAQIGEIVGKLHLHSSRWKRSRGFTRPHRNAQYFDNCLAALLPAVDDRRIEYNDYKQLETAIRNLHVMMKKRPKSRQSEGLLHGDLHRGNFLFDDGDIRLIDFSFACIGSYMFDLGICMASITPEFHNVFLVNYDRLFPLPNHFGELIEGYFIGGLVGTFSFWVNDPEAQEVLVQRVPYVAREFAARFNRQERFWFD